MAKKKGVLESKGFKLFMKYLYGLGAAVVIAGALFKIMHWPFASAMLIAGMGTEVVVFLVSAFEPLHEDLDWSKVYPQLAEESDSDFLPLEDEISGQSSSEALSAASKGMKDIEISPDLFEGLKTSLNGLKDNVNKLSTIQDASVATSEYTDGVRNAASKMSALNESYTTTLSAMNNLSSSVGGAAENAKAYHEEVQRVTKNLSSLNAVYEMELADAQSHVKSLNQFYESLTGAMKSMQEGAKEAEAYRNEVATLTTNIRALNRVYGGMLSAMSSGAQG